MPSRAPRRFSTKSMLCDAFFRAVENSEADTSRSPSNDAWPVATVVMHRSSHSSLK